MDQSFLLNLNLRIWLITQLNALYIERTLPIRLLELLTELNIDQMYTSFRKIFFHLNSVWTERSVDRANEFKINYFNESR